VGGRVRPTLKRRREGGGEGKENFESHAEKGQKKDGIQWRGRPDVKRMRRGGGDDDRRSPRRRSRNGKGSQFAQKVPESASGGRQTTDHRVDGGSVTKGWGGTHLAIVLGKGARRRKRS